MLKATSVLLLAVVVFVSQSCSVHAGDKKLHPYFKMVGPYTKKAAPKTVSKTKHSLKKNASPAADAPWYIADLCSAYSLPQNLNGNGVIGILELGGGWVQSDLDQFCTLNNLPPITVTNISVGGAVNSPSDPPDPNSDDVEVTLDIEIAAAVYYYTTGKMPVIKVFFADNTSDAIEAVVNAAVDEKCDVLSISWGADEASWEADSPGAAASLEVAAKAAVAKGMVILAASGDYSSSDFNTGNNVDVPSSCPHVIGCGGTKKTTDNEVVWGDGVSTDYGTGGGFSVLFPKQAFQLNAPSGSGRMVPDVAANADPNTGYIMVYGGEQWQVGGTSAVAPFYAGLFAATGKKLGFITPTLWSNPAAFTDIVSGSNGGYSAAVGPDACTGLGVPNGASITSVLATIGHLFTISVIDRTTGNFTGTLGLDQPEQNEFEITGRDTTGTGTYRQYPPSGVVSTVIGRSPSSTPLFPGTFVAIVIDFKALGIPYLFDHTAAQIWGTGYGLNSSRKFEIYNFRGQD